jgi:hypothetical protein
LFFGILFCKFLTSKNWFQPILRIFIGKRSKFANFGKKFTSCQIHALKVQLHCPHYKGMLNFFLISDLYSQILLNLLIWTITTLATSQKLKLKNTTYTRFQSKIKSCLEFQAYWW